MRQKTTLFSETGALQSFSSSYKARVLASVTVSRAIYSLNWYTLSPGLARVASDFHASLQGLGILESAFLLGAGIFQVPSSYAAARWDAKTLVVTGLLVIAAANLLAALSPTFEFLIAMRFLLGIGASMFFSPAIVIVAPLFRNERQGIAVGLYNAAFNVGGFVALSGWGFFVEAYSWRAGLEIGAVMALGVAALSFFGIKHTEQDGKDAGPAAGRAVIGVLMNRQVWLIGLGIVGLWSTYYTITQFLPLYEVNVNLLPASLAGMLASLLLIMPIPGSLVGGFLSDRLRNRKAFLLYPTIMFGIGTAVLGYSSVAESVLLLASLGFLDSFVFSSMYAAPFQMDELAANQKAISISLMNSVQISGAFVLPIIFTIVAGSGGYAAAWILTGVFCLAFFPLLLFVREPFKKDRKL